MLAESLFIEAPVPDGRQEVYRKKSFLEVFS